MVMRWSAGSWLEDQDMWRMSGIFRSVWLLNKPQQHLSDVQLSPQLDALYRDGELQVNRPSPRRRAAGRAEVKSLWDGEQRLVAASASGRFCAS
jgi:beta-galactosidase